MVPYLLQEPAAPHWAAALEGAQINGAHILACHTRIAAMADAVVVEGVGGFRVPLTDGYDSADLAQQLGLPLVLVVGLRLGCINHALLTAEAIAARGLKLAGWVANLVDPEMRHVDANLEAIKARIDGQYNAPLGCGSRVPLDLRRRVMHDKRTLAAAAAAHLDFSLLPSWPG